MEELKACGRLNKPENVSMRWVKKGKYISPANFEKVYAYTANKRRLGSLLKEYR